MRASSKLSPLDRAGLGCGFSDEFKLKSELNMRGINAGSHSIKVEFQDLFSLSSAIKEEIIESPTEMEEGELMKFFKCDYCGYKERRAFRVAKLKKTEGQNKSSGTLSS